MLVRIAGTASRGVICVMLQTVYSNRHCSVQHRKSKKLGTMIYTSLQHLNLMGPPMLCDRVLHLESAGHVDSLERNYLSVCPRPVPHMLADSWCLEALLLLLVVDTHGQIGASHRRAKHPALRK